MKVTNLGEFEELVLLVIGALNDDAYSISIQQELREQTGRSPSIGAMHSALNRLENKGFINSHEGGATKERGGRRKRFYQITAAGKSALSKNHELRSGLIKLIPGMNTQTGLG
ncbi:MAG: PadR family transcriptional regulator [Cyclobacteriaceae bacterium]